MPELLAKRGCRLISGVIFALCLALPIKAARLVWDPNITPPASYNFYYSGAALPLQKQSAGTNTAVNIDFLPAGQIYTLFVTAVSAEGVESDPSDPVTYSPAISEAPAIVTEPASQTVIVGQPLTLRVFATGTAPLAYQWSKDGVDIAGATSDTFSIAATQVSDAGAYSVRVSNSLGSAVSLRATVSVLIAPSISSQPVSQTVIAGAGVTLTVSATGSAPLTYQWFKNGVAIIGATSATFSIASAQNTDNGLYTVVVSNQAGSATTSGATITVLTPPAITVQPQAQTVNQGSSVTLTVTATGSAPLSYQWLKFGANIPGANGSTFSIPSATGNDAATYSVRISNGAGTVTSSGAAVTVIVPPAITSQPLPQTLNAGSTLTLSASASGTIPLTFQWSKDNVDVAGATSATFVKAAVQGSDAGNYRVRISNAAGAVTSSIVSVTIISPPAITTQPVNQAINFGQALNLSVQATGSQPLSFQWRKDGTAISGATASSYQVANASTSDAGVYVVDVSNSAGSVSSAPATVTVFLPDAPSITQQPVGTNVIVGVPFSLRVLASGSGTITYQWLKNGSPIVGATSSVYSVASAQASDSGSYVVRVSNVGGNTLSVAATVTVGTPPSITTQPVSQSIDAGLDAQFSVQAAGSAPFSFQWQHSGVAIPDATNSTLTISQIKAADGGAYRVFVSNSAGSVFSQSATLTVTGAPLITTQPQSQTIAYGATISLSVAATGAAPLNFRWIKNGAYITGATASSLQIPNADQTDSGNYSVEISNGAGQVTSQTATVTVQAPVAPTIIQQPVGAQLEPGAALVLSVQATGTTPLSYQWLKNDALIVGATTPTFQIASVQPSDAATYKVRVSNIGGNIVSQGVVVSVGTAPAITSQPTSTSRTVGQAVTFTVQASGSAPLSFHWKKSGIFISGATSSSYSITQVASGDAGTYSCEVTNFAGTAVSQSATLTVLIPPAITTQPVSRAVDVGGSTTFLVEATGTGPLQYQWSRNGAAIPTATNSTYFIPVIALADGGAYTVQVTGPGGSVGSQSATLTVTGAPAIVTSPQNQTLGVGSPLTLTVQVTGAAPLAYQWKKNGGNISGGTNATFSIASVQVGDSGTYSVTVSNGAGSATSSGAAITVLTPPQITTQPANQTVNAGATISLSVVATGSAPLSFQWMKFGSAIPGATSATLSIPSATSSDAGSYSVRVSNQVGSAASVAAQVSVITPPTITTAPVGQTLNGGSTLTLTVAASGSQPFSYQWIKDGTEIPGATSGTFVKSSVQASDAGNYSVRVSNSAGTVTSASASIIVITPPAITADPVSKSVNFGEAFSLTVQVTGTPPLSFRWVKDGADLAGANGATYSVASADTSHSGIYFAIISNSAGTVTSKQASVSVILPNAPTINTQPQSVTVTVNSPVTLTVAASGTGTLFYQWLKNGVAITGATSPTFSIASAQTSDAATYNVRVSNAGGSTLSASAVVTVGVPPSITTQPVSQSVDAGLDAQFSVTATGSAPLTYKWLHNGVIIAGATGSTLQLTQIKAADGGSYQVEISNNAGKAVSELATLTVTGSPVITSQPVSQTIAYGSLFAVSITVNGAQPMVFRWIKDGSFIPGATGSSYQVPSADLTHSGNYSVEVSNGAGVIVSQTAVITVTPPPAPTILQQPSAANPDPGATVVFSVQASGLGVLSYQWFKNQTAIPGATGSSYTISSVQLSDAGNYAVQVSNLGGNTMSTVALLKVGTAPSILVQPVSQTVETGNPVTLSVQASGTAPLTYRWSKAGVPIAGATSSSFTIAQVAETDAGGYTVEISNIAGTVNSQAAVLSITIAPKPPVISAQPVSRSVDVGGATTFFVQAAGSGTLSYEWIHNGLTIPGATNASLTLAPVSLADGGIYLVKISNIAGSVVSDPATLTVTGAPVITVSPQGQSISESNSLVLSVQVSGVAPFAYRWIKGGAVIPNATQQTFQIAHVQLSDAGNYSVEVSNAAGTALSEQAIIEVIAIPGGTGEPTGVAPTITRQPVAQTVDVGGSATFVVEATGTAPVTFAWIHNGAYVVGATNAVFTISATTIADAGTYSVEVGNSFGKVVSDSANLSVVGAPVIRSHPQSQTLTVGGALALNVDAGGAAPLRYQWKKGGAIIIGATNVDFLIPAVQLTDAGNYSVTVSNGAGAADSQVATVTVLLETTPDPTAPVAPTFTRHPESAAIEVGKPVTFIAEVSGTAPLTYRWRRNGVYITGATSSSFTIDAVKVSDGGTYAIEASNIAGTAVSQGATLLVTGAPRIVAQPQSATVTVSNTIALSVDVTGATPMTFRWIKGGAYVPSATNINYIIPLAQLSDSGNYSVEVANAAGTVLSQTASISVVAASTNGSGTPTISAPVVTRDPISQSVESGTSVTFSVEAIGTAPLSFKWTRNGVYVDGVTSPILTIPSASAADAGTYRAEISNPAGVILSKPATLTLLGSPTITRHPQSQTLVVGDPLVLSVSVDGATPLTYRWIKDGDYIPAATNGIYIVSSAQLVDAGTYSVQIANTLGEVVSQAAVIAVLTTRPGGPNDPPAAPVITASPVSQAVNVGDVAIFHVTALSSTTISYRWVKDGAFIPGATSDTLTINSTALANAGNYTVEVSNSVGKTVSQVASLSVLGVPVILSQPQGQALNVGDQLDLSVTYIAVEPVRFRWIKGGAIVLGATNRTFSIASVKLSDAGSYAVEISNGAGAVVSETALIRVSSPSTGGSTGGGLQVPVITAHPVSLSVEVGSEAVFSVTATATSSLQYAWIHNGAFIPGANSSVYRLPAVQVADAGSYAVQVSSANASIISKTATLEVTGKPEIFDSPESQEVAAGETLLLRVFAVGAEPLQYKWVKGGAFIPGATNASLSVPNFSSPDTGVYWVEISNAAGTAISSHATITIYGAPSIVESPLSQTVSVGSPFTLTVGVDGAAPFRYQWIKSGTIIVGATNSTFQVAAAQNSDAALYWVEVSNGAGTAVSDKAQITVTGAPIITEQPASQTVTVTDPFTLNVEAVGVTPFAYRWIKGGVFVTGATNKTFAVASAQLSDAGSYSVEVSNAAGQALSAIASVRVVSTNSSGTNTGGIVITTHPESQTIDAGGEAVFTVEATGPAPLRYLWSHDGTFMTTATNAELRITNLTAINAGAYAVRVSSGTNSVTSESATLTVVTAPLIVTHPQNESVPIGGALQLSVEARGAQPLTYKWIKNGAFIPNATNSTISIASVVLTDGGSYSVEVRNSAGTKTSRTALVTITGAPVIRTQPVGKVVPLGTSFTLSVEVDGAAPFAYRWIKGGAVIPNATNTFYTVALAKSTDAGSYTVEVSNGAGSVVSSPAQITVTSFPTIVQQPASQTVTIGSPINLNVEVGGASPFNFRWIKNGGFISGATNKTFSISSAQLADAGTYSVEVSNGLGVTNSQNATVTVTNGVKSEDIRLSIQPGLSGFAQVTITAPAGDYTIEFSDNIAPGQWITLFTTNISTTKTFSAPVNAVPHRFFRSSTSGSVP